MANSLKSGQTGMPRAGAHNALAATKNTTENSGAKQVPDGIERRYLEERRDEDIADMLSNLENNNFIPVSALTSVAEILTYLYEKDVEYALSIEEADSAVAKIES